MSNDLLKRAEYWMTYPPDAKPEDAWFVIRDLAARVRELEAELHFKACLVHDLLPYQERAVKAEAENEALRALLRTCPYEVNKPQSIADAQWVRDVRAALGDRHD